MGCDHSTLLAVQEMGCKPGYADQRRGRRKKPALEASAEEAKPSKRHDGLMSCVPGRMCINGSSRTACTFTQQGRKGINQDALIVWENFGSRADTVFCGVFDGHGPQGHLVARKVRDMLPAKVDSYWKGSTGDGEDEEGRGDGAMVSHMPEAFRAWRDCFLAAYNEMDRELKTYPTIDCFCSGTTAVTLLLQDKDLIIANVGDSRAVLGTRNEDNNIMDAIPLTVDLKPNLPDEAERIKRCEGRVFSLEDEPEVVRIWLPHDNSPGLAMARAFGDFCLKDFGLIAVPDISYRRITQGDRFIVLATDGVWDVMSNKEVVDVVSSAPFRATSARAVVEAAVCSWRVKYPASKVDDCAVVCLFLDQRPPLRLSKYRLMGFHDDGKNSIVPARSPPKAESCGQPTNDSKEAVKTWLNHACDTHMGQGDGEGAAGHEYTRIIDEWSVLDGIARVDSLLNLPRRLRSTRWKR